MWSNTNKILLVLVVLLVLTGGGLAVVNSKRLRGKAFGGVFLADAMGVVRTPPEAILSAVNAALVAAGRAPVTLDALSLARALSSEHGSGPPELRRWVGWAIRNNAGAGPGKVFRKLTHTGSTAALRGLYARQRVDGRYAATNSSASLEDLEIARSVLSSAASADPTKGSTNFFSPRAQDALFKRKQAGDPSVAKINRNANDQRKKWLADGLVSRGRPAGVPVDEVEFFASGRLA